MLQDSFLHCVARVFLQEETSRLKDFCFVFPNRRSCLFFERELEKLSSTPLIFPYVTTISDFVTDLTHMVTGSRVELLLELYHEYVNIAGENAESFDEFSYWGEMIINDFSDIDLYLVDADKIFKNLKEFKDIGTDYLSQEQKKVLNEYFNNVEFSIDSNVERFWKHSTAYNNETPKEYFNIWDMLSKLYYGFNKRLDIKNISYTGKAYRRAVDILKNSNLDKLDYKQYIFVGFNVLSASEWQIFKTLQKKNLADFYWDTNSPALKDLNNNATNFISKNISHFHPKHDLKENENKNMPHISVKAIPTNVGQTKYAVRIVEDLINSGKIANNQDLLNTAIVLPDENLFIPLIGSIDTNIINKVNVTMGFPLRKSLISSFLSTLSKTHRQSRKINGEYCFYIEDLKSLISHPYIKLIAKDEIRDIQVKLNKERKYFVSAKLLKNECPILRNLFAPIEATTIKELIDYTNRILSFLDIYILNKQGDNETIETTCVRKYIEQFQQLINIVEEYNITLNDNTFFYLIDRFISSTVVSLQGEPLDGLQVMGVLETRCLDFKNIIVLSMNERIFPRKHFSRSFIPYNIRKGYNMSTIEHQESMYSYYFYRMISRAENVFLLYDARTSGISAGDPSRYIQQLCKIYNDNIEIENVSIDISAPKDLEIKVPKTKRIMDKLNLYRTEGSGKFLSASAINSYISCPLKFYFEKVEGLYIEDKITEFMDYSTFGTIIHEIMHEIYSPFKGQLVTIDHMTTYLENKANCLDRIIKKCVNKIYYKKGDDCYDEFDGEGYVIEGVIKHYIKEILKYDSKQEFVYLQGEESGELEEKGFWTDLGVNFKQYIDRVDMVKDFNGSSYIRIIDYKTGNDETKVSDFNAAMDNSKEKIKKAIIQIFLYCNFYNYIRKTNNRIKPMIYTVKDMSQAEIKINRNVIEDYHDYNGDFISNIKRKIDEMFDVNVQFTQTQNKKNCSYCKFKDFCRK